jgi:hypothetical protein
MPNALWRPFREGNRSEYLAQYFLSALGVSAPVLRQEDIGVDFYCALAEENGSRLTFHSPFAVQVGSKDGKDFKYGGLDRKGRWRVEQIEWLFAQELPLFLCVVDKAKQRCEIFSTSPMWLVRYQFGTVSEVVFEFGANHDILKGSREVVPKYAGKGNGDGCRYRVPLPQPVVSLAIGDLTGDAVDRARIALRHAIELEAKNLTFRRLQVHHALWFPNPASLDIAALGYFASTEPGRNTDEQLNAALPILVALAYNYKAQGRLDELTMLKDVFRLLPTETIPLPIREMIPELLG